MEGIRSKQWISTQEAATILGCTVQHIRLLLRQERIRGSRFGRDWFAERKSVKRYAALREIETTEQAPAKTVESQYPLYDDPALQQIVNVSSVPQRSPFRYPGGKTWLVPIARLWLAGQKNPHTLVEPFAGGGGIGLMAAFERYVQRSLLVELDPDIAAVWRTILGNRSGELAARIREFVCVEESVRRELGRSPKGQTDRAFLTLLRNRVSRGGILAPGAGLVRTGEANRGIASRWYPETLATRIQAIHAQRSQISFREGDGLEVICEFAKDKNALFFVDPPYPLAGRRLYAYHTVDHAELFSRLASIQGNFIATYDDNDEIRKLANEFKFMWKLVPMKSTHHTRKFELIISKNVDFLSGVSSAKHS